MLTGDGAVCIAVAAHSIHESSNPLRWPGRRMHYHRFSILVTDRDGEEIGRVPLDILQ